MTNCHYILRSGLSKDAHMLKRSEIGFNQDTDEVVIGLGEGKIQLVSKIIVRSETSGLYAETPIGLIPMCIRELRLLPVENTNKPKRRKSMLRKIVELIRAGKI